MHFLSSFIFAITVNIDNFAVGIAYGIKGIKVGQLGNLIIAFISAVGTFLSMSLGLIVCRYFPLKIANLMGSLILIGIGLWFIIDFLFKCKKEKKESAESNNLPFNCIELLDSPEKADLDHSGTIDHKESIALAVALSLNNIGLGLGSSISGSNIFITTLLTFVISIPTIMIGCHLGNSWLSTILGKYTALISGMIVIGLGIFEIFI